MIFLFPQSFIDRNKIESHFIEQSDYLSQLGHTILRIGEHGLLKKSYEPYEIGIYRGWMMTIEEYKRFYENLFVAGIRLITTPEQYEKCHYITGWYKLLEDLTIPSLFFKNVQDITNLPQWKKYFVKDFVKSLSTGSVAENIEQIYRIVKLNEQYRGLIEGGICVRQYINLDIKSENRYFVYKGTPYSDNGIVPEIVHKVVERIDCPFYSVDIAKDKNGKSFVIEIGDGQVSDYKSWNLEKFLKIFS